VLLLDVIEVFFKVSSMRNADIMPVIMPRGSSCRLCALIIFCYEIIPKSNRLKTCVRLPALAHPALPGQKCSDLEQTYSCLEQSVGGGCTDFSGKANGAFRPRNALTLCRPLFFLFF
jgi:hypothetical protein